MMRYGHRVVLGIILGLVPAFAAPIPQSSCTFTNPANPPAGFTCNLYPSSPTGGINDVNAIPFPVGYSSATDPLTSGYIVILQPGADPNDLATIMNPANYRQVVYFVDNGLGAATGIILYTRGCNNLTNPNDVSCFPSYATINTLNNFFTAPGAGQPPAPYPFYPDGVHFYNVFFVPIPTPAPAVISKAFAAAGIASLGTTNLSLTVSNSNPLPLTGVAFTDTLPAGLVVATPNGLASTCGGTSTATAGGNLITTTGATVAGVSTCTVSLNVKSDGTVLGLITNTTSTVTSNEAAAGAAASASIFIGDPFFVNYGANLSAGESYISITNTGTNGAMLNGPGFGAPSGNICVNVYAFDPAEELIACCSCLITPDQTVNLGFNRDLTARTLTGVIPTSVTVALIANLAGTGGSGTSCTNTAATTTAATLASGMAAWGTTLHPMPTGGFATTEKAFTKATLGAGELASLTGRCASVLGNGGGFGVCNSCKFGALGSSYFPQ